MIEKKMRRYSDLATDEVKRLNIPIDPQLHRSVKILVAEQGITVAQFVRDAIAEKLERERTGVGE